MKIKHYDLFAGIGGFSLALDTVFNGHEIEHIFSEWEAFPTAVLKKHWPDGTFYKDIDQMVIELTCMSSKEYNNKYGLSTVEQIRQRSKPLSKRDVNTRHRELLRYIEASDVEDFTTKELHNALKSTLCGEESFLQRDGSERPSTQPNRESCEERGACETGEMSEMRRGSCIQEREDGDTSTSSGLQQTAGSDVALPEMPSRMAQEKQGYTSKKINYDITTNTTIEGRERESRNTEGQSGLCDRKRGNEKQNLTILTGGFPCQEFSQAGKRKGTDGARYKWPEMLSLIHKIKPDWVIAENVRGLTTWEQGLALETVCTNLEECGYSLQTLIIPAVAVGAPHRRDRVWIIARNTDSDGCFGRDTEIYATERREPSLDNTEGRHSEIVEPTPNSTSEQGGWIQQSELRSDTRTSNEWNKDWREVALATCHDGVDDGLPRRMDGITISAARHRKERLKACGNAIVPQVAEMIFEAIKESITRPRGKTV